MLEDQRGMNQIHGLFVSRLILQIDAMPLASSLLFQLRVPTLDKSYDSVGLAWVINDEERRAVGADVDKWLQTVFLGSTYFLL